MIRPELKSRLMELEKRYAAAVQAKRDEKHAPARWAYTHAKEAAALVLYGEPKMEEPLHDARFHMQQKLDKEFAAAADEHYLRAKGEKPNGLIRSYLCPTGF